MGDDLPLATACRFRVPTSPAESTAGTARLLGRTPGWGEVVTGPTILDLCCRVGGASAGYVAVGWNVVGVDIEPIEDYPFEFHQADALEFGSKYGGDFDAAHASFPCQSQTTLQKGTNKARGYEYPNLIPAGREMLLSLGIPFVMENVPSSELRRDVVLCGEMFGLSVIRHRVFEVHGFDLWQPPHVKHRGRVAGMRHGEWFTGPYFAVYGDGGGKGTVEQWQQAMGIGWTADRKNLAEAIPPAYTEFIGAQLLEHLAVAA